MTDETDVTGEVARVLGTHYPDQTSYDAGDLFGCACGWEVPQPRSYGMSDWDAYWAHQAEALAKAGLLRPQDDAQAPQDGAEKGADGDRASGGGNGAPERRLRACVENWPEAETGAYNPSCCRFPKSCSATVYDPERVTEDDLEAP